jgi:tRNA threonylcarbamoyladenosine biosynthesis protein TsaB
MMIAIECSSLENSVALFSDGQWIDERRWRPQLRENQRLFSEWTALFDAHGVSPESLQSLAVGCGPGNYSGLRMAVAACEAYGLAREIPVVGVSSGDALAWQILQEQQPESLVVVGDARRHKAWFARYDQGGNRQGDWALHPIAELDQLGGEGTVLVSSDWDRLKEQGAGGPGWLEAAQFPSARSVGVLALRTLEAGLELDRPAPIYLHPPVAEK